MALLNASGCIPERYRSLARTTVLFSTIETKLLIDTRALVTFVSVRPNAVAIYGPKSRINVHVRKGR